MAKEDLLGAVEAIASFGTGSELTSRIATIESSLEGKELEAAEQTIAGHGVDDALLAGALTVKQVAGQINVVIHAVGILLALPHIMEDGERIKSLSLGAGNTGRDHDLVTDRRVAEFKFIEWRGGAESIRQNGLFIDLFNLALASQAERRCMYVVGRQHPDRFLRGRRTIASVLSRNSAAAARFKEEYGDQFITVADYAEHIRDDVEIVDLREIVPQSA